MANPSQTNNAVEMYLSEDGNIELQVFAQNESVWLNRQQIAKLFSRDVKTVGKHIANALLEELDGEAVVAKFATTASDGKLYQVEYFNLDVVISVGYRVKSVEGVKFRRWANKVLNNYLVKGVAANQQRLDEIGSIVKILSRATIPEVAGVAVVLSDYLPSLQILQEFDNGKFSQRRGNKPHWQLSIAEARKVINEIAISFPGDRLFGKERGQSLEAVIEAIYQGFEGIEIYPTVEMKAANLLYLMVKDHPLTDGNKRSAAALFVTFISKNAMRNNYAGQERFSNNALAAITLLLAMSEPREKELMVSLIIRMMSVEETGIEVVA